jgi:hypothetical protein
MNVIVSNGRLILVGGKPLSTVGGPSGTGGTGNNGTTGIALTTLYLGHTMARFNFQPSAASGNTLADIPVLFTYTGSAPTSVQARAIDSTGTAVPGADWTPLQSVTIDSTAKTGLGYLPGVRVGAQYRREVRVGTDNTVKATDVGTFNVGPCIVPEGQSNMVQTLDGNIAYDAAVAGVTPTTTEINSWRDNGTAALFGLNGYIAPASIGGTGSNSIGAGSVAVASGGLFAMQRIVANRLASKYGRKVGVNVAPWARNATAISSFLTGDFMTLFTNTGTTAGSIGLNSPAGYASGDYQIVTWHQGENQSSTLTRSQRLTDLISFCQAHITNVAKYGRTADKLTFLFAMMGPYGLSPGGAVNVPHAEVLRGAVLDLIAYGKTQTPAWDVRIGWTCIDLDAGLNTTDGLHLFGDMKRQSCYRMTQGILRALDPTNVAFGGEGPSLTGTYTRSGDDITLPVAQNGGTALAAKTPGSPITGWYANTAADFSGTDIALTNVTIIDATHVRVTATGAPTTFYIKHCGGRLYTAQSYRPDVSNLVYDNVVYPTGANAGDQYTGLPLQPTPDAIRIG